MLSIFFYLLKVILCSGILLGYYWLALRNKVFHRYNRFYLLATVVLSLSLPLIRIPVWQQSEAPANQALVLIQAVNNGEDFIRTFAGSDPAIVKSNDPVHIYAWVYVAVSAFFLAFFLYGMCRIILLIKRNRGRLVGDVLFIETNAKGTPFSFLRYIFWNPQINIESKAGQQVFRHELAHVEEKHSYDKLFLQSVLIFCWCNPFFWITRKELHIIHEFSADQKALQNEDGSAFAAMILQAVYPGHSVEPASPFFNSSIKRRLKMLTKKSNPVASYSARIAALALVLTVAVSFTFKAKKIDAESPIAAILNANPFYDLAPAGKIITAPVADTVPHGPKQKEKVQLHSKADNITIFSDSIIFRPTGNNPQVNNTDKTLVVINGRITSREELSNSKILARLIRFYQPNDAEAINQYGEPARPGVIACFDATIVKDKNTGASNNTAAPAVAVGLDKMNVFYIGVDNPVTIAAGGISNDDLDVSMTGGSITGSNGKYTVRVTSPGEATINVAANGKLISSTVYKVKRVPDPSDKLKYSDYDFKIQPQAGIDGKHAVRMNVADFISAKKLTAGTGFEVSSVTVYFSGANFKDIVTANLSNGDLSSIKQYIDRCDKGSVITFDNIKVRGDENYLAVIDGLSVSLY